MLMYGHFGIPLVTAVMQRNEGREILRITREPVLQHPAANVGVPPQSPDYLTRLTAVALLHLRRGGVVSIAPDGRQGGRFIESRFFGERVMVARSAATLSRLSGAACIPTYAAYDGRHIRVHQFPRIVPTASEPDAWDRQWLQIYLDWIEEQWRAHPELIWPSQLFLKLMKEVRRRDRLV